MEGGLLFDTHCHIDFMYTRRLGRKLAGQSYCRLMAEFPALHSVRLHGFITNFCDPKLWNVIGTPVLLNYLEKEPGIFYTLGCHPHHADKMLGNSCMKALERLLKWGKGGRCVALGECGLDLSTNKPNWTKYVKYVGSSSVSIHNK